LVSTVASSEKVKSLIEGLRKYRRREKNKNTTLKEMSEYLKRKKESLGSSYRGKSRKIIHYDVVTKDSSPEEGACQL